MRRDIIHKLFHQYRPEHIDIDWDELGERKFKSVSVQEYCTTYQCPRTQCDCNMAIIFFPATQTMGTELATMTLTHYTTEQNCSHLIYFTARESNAAVHTLNDAAPEVHAEIIHYDEVEFDKLASSFVPHYDLLTHAARAAAYADMHLPIGDTKLPVISYQKDAIARLLGLRPNDLVKCTYPDIVLGEGYRYRICI